MAFFLLNSNFCPYNQSSQNIIESGDLGKVPKVPTWCKNVTDS